jgi:enoyl-CoA hydratase/carnithine racemase
LLRATAARPELESGILTAHNAGSTVRPHSFREVVAVDVRISAEGALLVITLDRPKANALNAAMVEELHAAIDRTSDPGVRGVVFTSSSHKVFCAGFDVVEVFAYDRAALRHFFGRFSTLFERIRQLPKPVVAAMSGHTYAGGAILSLACDVRVMADGACFALNEIDLGVVLPARLIRAMIQNSRRDVMRSLLLGGEAVNASRALACGLITELAPAIDVLPVALTRARHLAEKPSVAFAAHKQALDTLGPPLSEGEVDAELTRLVDIWFGDEATARRRALIEKLAKKS